MNTRSEMLNYLNELACILDSLDVYSSFAADDEYATLAWYDNDDARNSLTIWLDDFEGVWSVVKDGIVLDRIDFEGIEEFKEFTII